jgi:hypothetical protein
MKLVVVPMGELSFDPPSKAIGSLVLGRPKITTNPKIASNRIIMIIDKSIGTQTILLVIRAVTKFRPKKIIPFVQ